MKKLTNNQMAETQGGFFWAVFLIGLAIGYFIGAVIVGDSIAGSGGTW